VTSAGLIILYCSDENNCDPRDFIAEVGILFSGSHIFKLEWFRTRENLAPRLFFLLYGSLLISVPFHIGSNSSSFHIYEDKPLRFSLSSVPWNKLHILHFQFLSYCCQNTNICSLEGMFWYSDRTVKKVSISNHRRHYAHRVSCC